MGLMTEAVVHRKVSFLPEGKRTEEKTSDYPTLPDTYARVPEPIEALKPKFILVRQYFRTHRLPENISFGIPDSPEAQISVNRTHDETAELFCK
jgi:hypothetical protein